MNQLSLPVNDMAAHRNAMSPIDSHIGPGYAHMPNHGEDIRRLLDESIAAKEAARVLAEALVFTRPSELNAKPIINVSCFFTEGVVG